MNSLKKYFYKNNEYLNLAIIISIGFLLRLFYLFEKTGNIFLANLGGDSCYHYNVAYNIALGLGPKTSFIFSYWFYHDSIMAITDLYGPGYHYFLSFFLYFKNDFITLRISSLLVGLASVLLAYFLGKILHSKKIGYVSALIICFNFFHIENSTVVMRENFNLLLIQLFFLNLFLLNRNRLLFCSIGIVIGYSAMTLGAWIILLLIFFFYTFISFKKNFNFFINLLFFFISFLIIIYPWASVTYNYFGRILFNYMSFYPYVPDWGAMMSDRGLPNISNFWDTINLLEYFKNHLFWGLINLVKFHLTLFPTFAFPFSFILIPLIILGALKLRFNGFILLIFTLLYFLGLLFASYASQGVLWPRHFLVLLAPVSILMGYGLILFYYRIIEYKIFKKILKFFLKYKFLIYVTPILLTIIAIQSKKSFWERDSLHFYKFGEKIRQSTNEKDIIMYAYTVSDAWCSTSRKIVQDVAFNNIKNVDRVKEEIKKYKVTHLLIDISDHIYIRSHSKNINEVLLFYEKIKLELIAQDKINGYFFYKIIN
jgi:4-amino-4-deoxy-L-arabinose transferase-like glycosyltransferase